MSDEFLNRSEYDQATLSPALRLAKSETPENRSTAFVAGLQQARIDALEKALRAVDANMRGDGYYERTCRQIVDSALA